MDARNGGLGSDPRDPRASTHSTDDADAVVGRPIGTRSLIYGAKTLVTAVVVLVFSIATGGDVEPAFWVLVSAGALGVMFSLIERSTTRGAEVVSQRRVNVDVLGTVLLALLVNVVVYVVQR